VLTDDNFATIVGAVQQGRTIYDNIVKFLRFQLSTNIGALLAVFGAPLFGLPVPFNPTQILWVNIIMDGPPALALAFDPPRRGLMAEPPRPPDQAILSLPRLLRLAGYGVTMAAGTLLLMHWELVHGMSEDHARTLAFTTFVLFQFFNVFNARVGQRTAFSRAALRNGRLLATLVAVLALQVVVVYWPVAQRIFHTTRLGLDDWAAAVAVASLVLLLDEGRKLLQRLGLKKKMSGRE
jgi:Ca2+-transporting ATPase